MSRAARHPGRRLVAVVLAGLVCAALAPALRASGSTNRPPRRADGRLLPDARRALSIAQAGNQIYLSWTAEAGKFYTLMYTDQPSDKAVWQPLPGYENMPGTGKREQLVFPHDPARPRRDLMRIADAPPTPAR